MLVERDPRDHEELGDQRSSYLDPTQYEEIRIHTSGNYTGVGLDVSLDDGKVTVVDRSRAHQPRKPEFWATSWSRSTTCPCQANIEATVNRMRGAVGTPVTVDVLRTGAVEPLRCADAHGHAGEDVPANTSATVSHTSAHCVRRGAARPRARGARQKAEASGKLVGVILDLRNNPAACSTRRSRSRTFL